MCNSINFIKDCAVCYLLSIVVVSVVLWVIVNVVILQVFIFQFGGFKRVGDKVLMTQI